MIPEHYVQMTAILSLTAMGIVAVVVDGEMGQSLMIAVAAGIGAFVGYLFPRGGDDAKEV